LNEFLKERALDFQYGGGVMTSIFRIARQYLVCLTGLGMMILATSRGIVCFAETDSTPGLQTVPNINLSYFLVPYDESGNERPWTTGNFVSNAILRELRDRPITDVFIFSHGWRGDVDDAKTQYNSWVTAMASCDGDLRAMHEKRPNFRPLLIGLHWPSLPFGDEKLRAIQPQDVATNEQQIQSDIDFYEKQFPNTARARAALRKIRTAAKDPPPEELPKELSLAFKELQTEVESQTSLTKRPVEEQGSPFNPDELYKEIQAGNRGLRVQAANNLSWWQLMLGYQSFWRMKERALHFGETGAHQLLNSMQQTTKGRDVRFHLMGHSFGCIVVSACVKGHDTGISTSKPVDSLCLVQGALSLWSYCEDINANVAGNTDHRRGPPGHFYPIVARRLVNGPIITTQSEHDSAVCGIYPLAAWWGRQRLYATEGKSLPPFGAVGEYGLRGPGCQCTDLLVKQPDEPYSFRIGGVYNLDCSRVICNGGGLSGAHSDICHPEIAHAIWQAATVGLEETPKPDQNIKPAPQPSPAPDLRPQDGPIRRWLKRRH
jgi:hypothetical protein